MGEAVPAFVLANGPAKITNYNFLKIKGATIDTALVVHRPVEGDLPPSHSQQKHDLADIYDVTPLGCSTAKARPNKQAQRRPTTTRRFLSTRAALHDRHAAARAGVLSHPLLLRPRSRAPGSRPD